MKIITNSIKEGYFDDEFGKFGHKNEHGIPDVSIPFTIIEYPKETKAFALILIDYDATPVAGAPFIHWLVSDFINPTMEKGESHKNSLIEGINSWYQRGKNKWHAHGYGGMAPPDKDHIYTLYVFALSEKLNIDNGFFLNEMIKNMEKKVIVWTKVESLYRAH
ncbi:MAG: YbhB/YbcL family Raf kinase inhibitor-like protein [Bacilli bacterium]